MPEMRRTIKDSVFTYLFSLPEYTQMLYQTLHPEDTDVAADDIKLVTLENVLSDGQYNDLGIQVRDKLLLLMEAQSTFSENLALRMLFYVAETYKRYVDDHNLDLYSAKPVVVPRPELYVLYTGVRKNVPEALTLSSLFEGTGDVDVTVRMVYDGSSDDILAQYVQFCKISDEQRKLYGLTRKAVKETIRICKESNVLVSFLTSMEKEVTDIMVTLYDQERIQAIREYNLIKNAEAEANENGIKALVENVAQLLAGHENLADEITKRLVASFGLSSDEAKAKTSEYLPLN